MFPIPWNRAFRKKDGTLVNIADAMSGGGGESELPDYSVADAGKVLTVDENGDLEWDTKGSGGGEYVMSWDFTKFGNITRNNVAFSSAGATFDGIRDNIPLFATTNVDNGPIKDVTIYVSITSLSLLSGTHRRFIMASESSGLIYRSTGVWGFYYGSDWESSEITDGDFFNNSKVKIYVDSDNKWHIYKNGVLIFEPTHALALSNLYIGSSDTSINNGVITGVRIYSGDYTET